jgi:hypothetical protein
MSSFYSIARLLHIAGGATALSVFWLPLVAKKGGKVHRRAGWVYVVAMALVAVTGAVLAIRYLLDDDPNNDTGGLFLLYVGLLSATSASMGMRVLGQKHRTSASTSVWDLGFPTALLLGGVALGAKAVTSASPLLGVFAALGIFIAAQQLRAWRSAPKTKLDWLLQHMGGMGASCIATVTAFLVVNAGRFGLERWAFFVWVMPGVLGGVGLALWQRAYQRRSTT